MNERTDHAKLQSESEELRATINFLEGRTHKHTHTHIHIYKLI
jgi:hypothetical protein